jgi:hypothetical protein
MRMPQKVQAWPVATSTTAGWAITAKPPRLPAVRTRRFGAYFQENEDASWPARMAFATGKRRPKAAPARSNLNSTTSAYLCFSFCSRHRERCSWIVAVLRSIRVGRRGPRTYPPSMLNSVRRISESSGRRQYTTGVMAPPSVAAPLMSPSTSTRSISSKRITVVRPNLRATMESERIFTPSIRARNMPIQNTTATTPKITAAITLPEPTPDTTTSPVAMEAIVSMTAASIMFQNHERNTNSQPLEIGWDSFHPIAGRRCRDPTPPSIAVSDWHYPRKISNKLRQEIRKTG